MAGERTLHRRIQIVLDYAKDGKHQDKDSLVEYIISRKPTNFIYYYRDNTTDKIVHGYSHKSVERTIQMCCDFKLLSSENLTLTKTGVSASDPRRFMSIIGKRAGEALENKGVSMASIEQLIRNILQSSDPKPSTAHEIWSKLGKLQESIDFPTFARLLNLLGQSECLVTSQKKIYLPKV